MSTAPLPYERVTSFYSYEATYPTLPKSGASLDAEFNTVRTALNATQSRLAEIQRDDGLLANASVHPQSLTAETFVLLGSDFVPQGSWLTATTYNPGDLVERLGLNYLATITHVSNNFDVDLAAGKWQAFGGYPTAAQVVFAPAGSVGSVSVQDAIIELDSDVQGKQPLATNLSAFGALVSSANKIGFFTGAGTMALADAPAYGRSVLAAPDAGAARGVLGLVTGTSAGNVLTLDGSARIPAVDGSQVTNVTPGDGTVTSAKMAPTQNWSSFAITMPPSLTPVFTKSYESPQQTITFAGALTLAHGMGVKPKILYALLVCQTAEVNYSVGDEVAINVGSSVESALDCGLSIVPDATNLNIRYGTNGITIINKGNGNAVQITAANWKLVVRAYA